MIFRKNLFACIILAVCSINSPAFAQNILTARSSIEFEHSLAALKNSIESHGYTLAHVQKCDSGLQGFGYQTDQYRVIFFGKLDEIRDLSNRHPDLIPFLPLKIAVFAEGTESILSAINPVSLAKYYPDENLRKQFERWEQDIRLIFSDVITNQEGL